MMHKCLTVKIEREAEKMKIKRETYKLNETRGKFIDFAEIKGI